MWINHYQLYSTNPVLWTSNFLTPTLTLTKSWKWCIIWICFECWILPQFCLLEFLARSYIKSIYKCCTLDFNAIFYINYRKPHPTFIQSIWPQIYPLLIPRGGNLPWFWVRMCGWSPRTPPHSYTRPSEKHDPFIYFPYRKLTPFIYYFRKLTPFIYYFSNFTHSYTFWVKKIPHWYTFDVKMIPIHILRCLKSIPHSSRTSVYTFIMEVTPPPPPWLIPT